MSELTTRPEAARLGDGAALDELCAVMYRELRDLARSRLRRSEKITLLDTTSLVHESSLRLCKLGRLNVADRSQFLAYAARVMRSTIVDFVRQRRAGGGGGGEVRGSLNNDICEGIDGGPI